MFLRWLAGLTCALCVLLHASTGAGQTVGATTGAIDGRISDSTGAALGGVTIRITGAALMGARAVVSGPTGSYQFQALPPGDYALDFERQGFGPEHRADVHVGLGTTRTLDVTLNVAMREEVVTVGGQSKVIDRSTTMMATNFDARELADLPGSRNMGAILSATPAVHLTRFDVAGSTAFAIGVYGAYGTTGGNRPTIDGISVTGLSPLGFTLDYGTFSEVSVGTGAYGPEWPSPGVHMQFITKSGGNQYHGTFQAGYENKGWQSRNIDAHQIAQRAPDVTALSARNANRLERYDDVNADVGGFVRKDRLWWYASVRDQSQSLRQVNFPVDPIETRVTTASGKGTLRVADNHRLVLFGQTGVNRQPIRLDGFLRGAATIKNTFEDSTTSQLATGVAWKAEWNAVLNGKLFFELRVGQFAATRAERPNGSLPRFEDLSLPDVRGGNRDWYDDFGNDQLNGSLSFLSDNGFGRHDIKAGGNAHRAIDAETWKHSYAGDVLHILQNGAPREVYLFQTPSRSESGQWWYSVYANDSWQANGRLTINAGLRFDRFRTFLPAQQHPAGVFTSTPESFDARNNLIDWNVLAPRIGVSHDLTGNGRSFLKLSYARYWLPPGIQLGNNVNHNAPTWWEHYTWSDAGQSGVWENGEQGTLLDRRGGDDAVFDSLAPDLKLPFVREVTVRFERQVAVNTSIQTGIVWRGERQQSLRQRASWPFEAFTIARQLPDPGADGTRGTTDDGPDILGYDLPPEVIGSSALTLQNVPNAERDYLTWDVTTRRRFSRRWSFVAAFDYTWNHDQASQFLGQPVRANEFAVTPNDLINTEGGRYVFGVWSAKVYGTYAGPWGLRVTPFLRHQSGQPFGRTVSARLDFGTIRVLAEPIGTRRQDHLTMLDVRVEKDLHIAGTRRLSGFVEVFNVLNANPAQTINWLSGPLFLSPSNIIGPRIARLGVKLEW